MRSMCGIREEAPFVLARLGGLFSYSLMCRRHMYMPRGAISTDALHPEIRIRRYAFVDTRIHLLKNQLDKIYCAQYNLIKDNSTPTTHFRKGEQAYENSL